jgi:hypothetical protein
MPVGPSPVSSLAESSKGTIGARREGWTDNLAALGEFGHPARPGRQGYSAGTGSGLSRASTSSGVGAGSEQTHSAAVKVLAVASYGPPRCGGRLQ